MESELGWFEKIVRRAFLFTTGTPEAERVLRSRRIAQLGKRDRELRRPPERVDARRHVPDAIPRSVLVAVVVVCRDM